MSKTTAAPPRPPATARTAPAQNAPVAPASVALPRRGVVATLRILATRRRFIVDRRSQFRAAFLVAGLAGVLLLMLNLSLYYSRKDALSTLLAGAPELGPLLRAQNRLELTLVLLGSFIFLVGVFVVTLLETHKTAGAALVISRRLRDLVQGRRGARLHLRKDDNLREIEHAFNALSERLDREAQEDARTLEAMARTAEELAGPEEAQRLAGRLREYAARRLAPTPPPYGA
jgi:hypothetical protein